MDVFSIFCPFPGILLSCRRILCPFEGVSLQYICSGTKIVSSLVFHRIFDRLGVSTCLSSDWSFIDKYRTIRRPFFSIMQFVDAVNMRLNIFKPFCPNIEWNTLASQMSVSLRFGLTLPCLTPSGNLMEFLAKSCALLFVGTRRCGENMCDRGEPRSVQD
jgi:hypothetical protein